MILVFVGAGGSAAVDHKRYPTTRKFFERLPDDIKNEGLFIQVCDFLRKQGRETYDIEDVLGLLDTYETHCAPLTDPTTLIGATMSGSFSMGITGIQDWQGFQKSTGKSSRDQIKPLNDRIKEHFFTVYADDWSLSAKRLGMWVRFLTGLKAIEPDLEVVTTNYDCVLESAFREAHINIGMGRRSDNIRTWMDSSPWAYVDGYDRSKKNGACGLLTKLHGSIDWQYKKNGGSQSIKVSDVFAGDHGKHCILYPGYKGVPINEPFRMFHNHFRKVVQGAHGPLTAAIFVGFAFRDEAINDVLSDLLPSTPTYFITKGTVPTKDDNPPPRAPVTNEWMHIRAGLTEQTVKEVLKAVQRDQEVAAERAVREAREEADAIIRGR